MDFGSEPGPKMACVVRGRAPVTSLSYHESGSHLFVASEGDSVLRVVDCLGGGNVNGNGSGVGYSPPSSSSSSSSHPPPRPQTIRIQREGIRTVRSTHHAHCVLFSPGGGSIGGGGGIGDGVPGRRNDVHYHSVHDNKILRSFGGHSGTIGGISVSPANDNFLSSSVDGTVR